jgi:transcriptional regulator with XRE-family HTH domain
MLKDRVKFAREQLGLTQDELAKKVGVTQQTIAKLENGGIEHPRYFSRLALALNVTEHWLLTGNDTLPPAHIEWLTILELLTEQERREIIDAATSKVNQRTKLMQDFKRMIQEKDPRLAEFKKMLCEIDDTAT